MNSANAAIGRCLDVKYPVVLLSLLSTSTDLPALHVITHAAQFLLQPSVMSQQQVQMAPMMSMGSSQQLMGGQQLMAGSVGSSRIPMAAI